MITPHDQMLNEVDRLAGAFATSVFRYGYDRESGERYPLASSLLSVAGEAIDDLVIRFFGKAHQPQYADLTITLLLRYLETYQQEMANLKYQANQAVK